MKLPLVGLMFYDHHSGDHERVKPLECSLVGWLYREDALYYHIASWVADHCIDGNSEVVHVLKADVVELYKLTPKKVKSISAKKAK